MLLAARRRADVITPAQFNFELDSRLIPLLVFVAILPFAAFGVWLLGSAETSEIKVCFRANATHSYCLQKKYPIDDHELHRRHYVVIVFYVLIRIVRSIVLTITVLTIIWKSVIEPEVRLRRRRR